VFLTADEICELTGAKWRSAQARALGMMGIESKTRPDGSLVVLRAHVEKVLGGVVSRSRKTAPDFSQVK
jgi:hypothetical protein